MNLRKKVIYAANHNRMSKFEQMEVGGRSKMYDSWEYQLCRYSYKWKETSKTQKQRDSKHTK